MMRYSFPHKINTRADEAGNVLFLILLAVALFAALSYAVTQTGEGGGGGDSETLLISSAQLTQYPAGVRTAVVRMVIRGADAEDLEFNSPSDFEDCAAGTNFQFCVFHPNGGGATYRNSPPDIMSATSGNEDGVWVYNAENEINFIGTTGSTDGVPEQDTVDVIAFLPGITRGICRRVNEKLGIDGIPVESGIDITSKMINEDSTTPYGVCNAGCGGTIGQDVPSLDGQAFGCFELTSGSDNYVYYHVLVER